MHKFSLMGPFGNSFRFLNKLKLAKIFLARVYIKKNTPDLATSTIRKTTRLRRVPLLRSFCFTHRGDGCLPVLRGYVSITRVSYALGPGTFILFYVLSLRK